MDGNAVKCFLCMFVSLVSLLTEADAAEPKFRWLVHGDAEAWGLSYAHPDSDVGLLWIWCQVATKEITMTPGFPTSGIKEGEQGAITLSTPTRKLRIEGEASFSEAVEAIEITASLLRPQDLAAIFEKPGSLKVEIPGNHATLPLNKEAKSAFAEFRRHCRF
jgi:hypothetical protein